MTRVRQPSEQVRKTSQHTLDVDLTWLTSAGLQRIAALHVSNTDYRLRKAGTLYRIRASGHNIPYRWYNSRLVYGGWHDDCVLSACWTQDGQLWPILVVDEHDRERADHTIAGLHARWPQAGYLGVAHSSGIRWSTTNGVALNDNPAARFVLDAISRQPSPVAYIRIGTGIAQALGGTVIRIGNGSARDQILLGPHRISLFDEGDRISTGEYQGDRATTDMICMTDDNNYDAVLDHYTNQLDGPAHALYQHFRAAGQPIDDALEAAQLLAA